MRPLLICAVVASFAYPAAALADDDDYERYDGPTISRGEAVRIARANGMVRIEEVERDDDGWEIEGYARGGREMEIEISRSGRILEIEYDD